MQPTEHHTRLHTKRDHEPYTPRSDASHKAHVPSLVERLGGEPYPQHPTRWYEWLASAFHVALLAASIAFLVFG